MRIVRGLEREKWSAFVKNHPNGTIFQSPEMYDVYCGTRNYTPQFFSAIDENDDVMGILLAVVQKEHSGIMGRFSSRSVIIGGPLVAICPLEVEIVRNLVIEYNQHIKDQALYTQIRNFWDCDHLKEFFNGIGYRHEDHLNYLHDLTVGEDDIWKKMNKKRRNSIRKGERKGTVIREALNEREIRDSYSILKQVYSNARLPIADVSLFLCAYKELNREGMLKCFLAFHDEKICGTIWMLNYYGRIYNWFAGGLSDHHDKHPNDILPWHAMKWGIHNDYKIFDFGGAGRPNVEYGVRNFKSKYGGEQVNYGRFEKVHKQSLFTLSKLGLALWRKMRA